MCLRRRTNQSEAAENPAIPMLPAAGATRAQASAVACRAAAMCMQPAALLFPHAVAGLVSRAEQLCCYWLIVPCVGPALDLFSCRYTLAGVCAKRLPCRGARRGARYGKKVPAGSVVAAVIALDR
ncbi:hypothetical protein GUJ93_ZPchr0013g34582 [Zizania palustris]|uniref:Uncharacterized protein n=1 Tax=Zizania palustris TaxID=103762 RepID=A0A8J6BU55_ZIZPA|nr:hypothetical protein GUJ93_ZPchr0013g34582 [Zizania palustris]